MLANKDHYSLICQPYLIYLEHILIYPYVPTTQILHNRIRCYCIHLRNILQLLFLFIPPLLTPSTISLLSLQVAEEKKISFSRSRMTLHLHRWEFSTGQTSGPDWEDEDEDVCRLLLMPLPPLLGTTRKKCMYVCMYSLSV